MWNAEANERPRPVAYVALQDAEMRADIVDILGRAGWMAIPQPTGFHLLQAIADVVDGKYAWLDPLLIVMDAHARGCAGTTIAAGLRELGIEIPVELVVRAGQPRPATSDDNICIADAAEAPEVVAAAARRRDARAPCLIREHSPMHDAIL